MGSFSLKNEESNIFKEKYTKLTLKIYIKQTPTRTVLFNNGKRKQNSSNKTRLFPCFFHQHRFLVA